MNNFRVPSEPCPLPSLGSGSDEESFVVLGNYPADLEDTPSVEIANTMAGMVAVVEEAKRLIVEEMAAVKTETKPDELESDGKVGPSDTRGNNQMERSIRLPDMPHMESGSESIGAISIANFTTDLSSEEVQNKISQIIDENIHLKDTIMQNTKTMNAQHERILAWYKESQKVHEDHKAKIYEAKAVIERLKKENELKSAELKSTQEVLDVRDEELKNLTSKITSMERKLDEKLTRTSNENLKEFELDVAQKKMRELESEMAIINLENFKLREESNKLNDEMEKAAVYEKHVKELQKLLDVSNNKIEELQAELANVQKTISENQEGDSAEVTSLRQQLVTLMKYQTNRPCPEDLDNAKKQLTNIQEQLLQTEQSRAEAYNQIAILNSQIEGLARQQRDLVEQNEALRGRGETDDEIYALKTQLDVYKTDFEAERTAKEALREEKEKLVDDLQNLQRRNQQLQEEIEITREHGDFVTFPSSARSTPLNSTTPSTPNDRSFQCPQCSFGFNNLQALQNHVYRCIELNETIP